MRAEKRREEKKREEKRREEKGREGKRKEEKGREGKRRKEKRREGKGSFPKCPRSFAILHYIYLSLRYYITPLSIHGLNAFRS